MTAPHIVDPAGLLSHALSEASPDLMRDLLQNTINMLLSADADLVAGAEYGRPSQTRSAQRNGYRHRELDTRVGTIDVAVPKLRSGSYFPHWLLERRKRAEAALITVVADCYLAGVSTRRMDKLVKTLGIDGLSRSQVSRMAGELDEQVKTFRHRPLGEAGPFTFVAADALTMKVREGGRVINAVVLIATGVNNDGHRECLGMQVATSETAAAWNTFFADLVARGLGGVRLVTSDAHAGLVEAIAANLMSVTPKSMWPAVKAMLHSLCREPDEHLLESSLARGEGRSARGLRPARRGLREHPVRPAPGTDQRACARGCRPSRCCTRGPAGVHRVPEGDLATDLVEQPPKSASTARSADARTPSRSSPTAMRSSASSVRSWLNRPMNGSKAAATSDSRSSAAPSST